MYRAQRNYGCRIHDQYTYKGMRTVVLENELVRVSILADKGTDIFEFLYKPTDTDFAWLTEHGVSNPNRYLPTSPNPIATFIDYYEGGWQEVFPNGGPTSTSLGAEYGQHGEIAHMPWDYAIVEDTVDKVAVRFTVRPKKIPVEVQKTLTLEKGSSHLKIDETITNLSEVELPYMWGHHIALGKPFLQPGCRIKLPDGITVITEAPDSEVAAPGRIRRDRTHAWPLATDHQGNTVDLSILPERNTPSEIVYLKGFPARAWYEVENAELRLGWRVEWDRDAMPYLWYWQEFGATKSYPWYGRHYNVGLEPFCGYPTLGLEEAIKNGSAGRLGAGQTVSLSLSAGPYRLQG